MRYLVKAKVKPGQQTALLQAIESGTLGRGSVAGDEYLDDMQKARVDAKGVCIWVEVCFCPTPLQEERPYWEQYFDLLQIKDAHARKNCRDANGTEPWACCNCDCTQKLEQRLELIGKDFLSSLKMENPSAFPAHDKVLGSQGDGVQDRLQASKPGEETRKEKQEIPA